MNSRANWGVLMSSTLSPAFSRVTQFIFPNFISHHSFLQFFFFWYPFVHLLHCLRSSSRKMLSVLWIKSVDSPQLTMHTLDIHSGSYWVLLAFCFFVHLWSWWRTVVACIISKRKSMRSQLWMGWCCIDRVNLNSFCKLHMHLTLVLAVQKWLL